MGKIDQYGKTFLGLVKLELYDIINYANTSVFNCDLCTIKFYKGSF